MAIYCCPKCGAPFVQTSAKFYACSNMGFTCDSKLQPGTLPRAALLLNHATVAGVPMAIETRDKTAFVIADEPTDRRFRKVRKFMSVVNAGYRDPDGERVAIFDGAVYRFELITDDGNE